MTTTFAVTATGLGRAFGDVWAIRDLNLQVPVGQRVALVGPNGSGKTTLLLLLATLLRPTVGNLLLFGFDPLRQGSEVRRRIGLMAHRPLLYESLTAEENLRFYAHVYDITRPSSRVDALLRLVGLEARGRMLVRALSRGLQQRLALARCLLHDPPLLLLDEPDTGLDEEGRAVLARVVAEGERTVLLATHQPEGSLAWADRVLVLRDGCLIEDRQVTSTRERPAAISAVPTGRQAVGS